MEWSELDVVLFITGKESIEFIKSAMEEWSRLTCVNFREKRDDDEDYIEFVYEQG